LFIYGCSAFVVSRPLLVRAVLTKVVGPVAGSLNWFVTSTMMVRLHRVSNALLVAALMFCISFFPRIMVESFQEKMVRGVRVSAGSDLGVAFAASELTQGEVEIGPIRNLMEKMAAPAAIRSRLQAARREVGRDGLRDSAAAGLRAGPPGSAVTDVALRGLATVPRTNWESTPCSAASSGTGVSSLCPGHPSSPMTGALMLDEDRRSEVGIGIGERSAPARRRTSGREPRGARGCRGRSSIGW
jgi:hypothetical protein